MRLLDDHSPEAEIRDLWSVLFDALVPSSGPADTLQGALLRAHGNLSSEYYRNGMMNYYADCLDRRADDYVEQLDLLIDTLTPEDKAKILEDRRNVPEAHALNEKEERSEAEEARLDALCVMKERDWESLFERCERLALNYCIAHPLSSFEPLLQRGEAPPALRPGARLPGRLGLQVTWSKEGLRVDGVAPGSPSDGKLQPGDIIDRIDGTETATLDGPEWAMKLLAGDSGATVFLRLGPKLVRLVRTARQE